MGGKEVHTHRRRGRENRMNIRTVKRQILRNQGLLEFKKVGKETPIPALFFESMKEFFDLSAKPDSNKIRSGLIKKYKKGEEVDE